MHNDYPTLTLAQLEAIVMVMDDEIRERIHSEIAPCEPGEFLTAYLAEDAEFPIHQFATAAGE